MNLRRQQSRTIDLEIVRSSTAIWKMSCTPCTIVRTNDDQWFAHLEGVEIGPYKDRRAVISLATVKALRLRDLGQAVRLVVQGSEDDTHAQLCLCSKIRPVLEE